MKDDSERVDAMDRNLRVLFWGTCGSLPSPIGERAVRAKIVAALQAAKEQELTTAEDFSAFVESLPLHVRGTYGGNTPCVQLDDGEHFILCDAGSGLRNFGTHLMQTRADALPTDFHIFMSHPHWDHVQGFPFFPPAYIPGNRVTIYGGHDTLEQVLRTQQQPPAFPVPFEALGAEIRFEVLELGKALTVGGYDVRLVAQNHPGVSYGYRFEKGGKSVVYSTDSEHREDMDDPDYPFVDFFRDSDLLIFDAQYTLAEAIGHKENWGHSSNLAAVELAARAGVKHLCLFHLEHTHSDDTLEEMLDNTRRYAKLYAGDTPLQVTLAYDGLEVQL